MHPLLFVCCPCLSIYSTRMNTYICQWKFCIGHLYIHKRIQIMQKLIQYFCLLCRALYTLYQTRIILRVTVLLISHFFSFFFTNDKMTRPHRCRQSTIMQCLEAEGGLDPPSNASLLEFAVIGKRCNKGECVCQWMGI